MPPPKQHSINWTHFTSASCGAFWASNGMTKSVTQASTAEPTASLCPYMSPGHAGTCSFTSWDVQTTSQPMWQWGLTSNLAASRDIATTPQPPAWRLIYCTQNALTLNLTTAIHTLNKQKHLKTLFDLLQLKEKAQDRNTWKLITQQVVREGKQRCDIQTN